MISRQLLVTTTVLFALTIFLAVYVFQLRHRELRSHHLPLASKAEPIIPPSTGWTERVTVFVAHDDPGDLQAQSISIPVETDRQQQAEAVLRGLIDIYAARNSPHLLAIGADVHDVFLFDPGIAVVDLNSPFVDGQVSGIFSEELTIASLVQTLATNFQGLTRVKFLVDGKERDTLAGHVDLSHFFDVSEVSDLAKELAQ